MKEKNGLLLRAEQELEPFICLYLCDHFFLIGEGKCSPLGLISTVAFFLPYLRSARKNYATVEINP